MKRKRRRMLAGGVTEKTMLRYFDSSTSFRSPDGCRVAVALFAPFIQGRPAPTGRSSPHSEGRLLAP
jgi:hypothetical protein